MNAALAGFASGLLAHAGFVALALAMDRHYRSMRGTRGGCPSRLRGSLRLAGSLALTASLVGCLRAWTPANGAVAWFGLLTFAALTLVLLLTYRPRAAPVVGLIAAILGILSGVAWVMAA